MGAYRVNEFDAASTNDSGYSIKKQFSPEMDLRVKAYYDATLADKQTVVAGTGGIPKLTVLKGLVGPDLTTISTTRAPASQDAAGNLGITFRSDAAAEGTQGMTIAGGIMADATEAMIGVILSHGTMPASGRLFDFVGADGTNLLQVSFNSNLGVFINYGDANRRVWTGVAAGALYCAVLHFTGGLMKLRFNGVEVGSYAYTAPVALLPVGSSGGIGAAPLANGIGIPTSTNTRITDIMLAETGPLPVNAATADVDPERDRNGASYFEAAMMWRRGIQGLLPDGHRFKDHAPITTWMGEQA